MSWSENHAESERLASEAQLAARKGDNELAREFYAKAAQAEVDAIAQIDKSKARTLGVTVVSAAALWYKAGEFGKTESIAYEWLGSGRLPPFASDQLKEILEKMGNLKAPKAGQIETDWSTEKAAAIPIVPKPGGGADILLDVVSFLTDAASCDNRAVHAAILFADLVGSTEFKRYHGVLQGIAKVVQHNEVARECIQRFGGMVVKYIGDGVIGLFKGENCEYQALQAGLETVRQIEAANGRQGWHNYPFAMSTKIGIHSGPVWMFQYAESPEDPQGTTIDIAARLVSLAGPSQVLCTKEVHERALRAGQLAKPRDEFRMYLKGMDEPFSLAVFVPEGFDYQRPTDDGLWTEVERKLRDAYQLMEQKRFDEAIAQFQQVANEYRGDFAANMCAAEQLLSNYRNLNEDRLRAAEVYVGRALSCRPDSSHAWLLAGWLNFNYYTRDKAASRIREAIEWANKAWRLARVSLNKAEMLQARVCLIHFFYALARQEGNQDALGEARRLCEEVQPVIDRALDACRSDFYVAYASVQLLSGNTDYDKLREMLNMAKQFNPGNLRVYEVEQELVGRSYPPTGG